MANNDIDLVNDFIEESRDLLQSIEDDFLKLEHSNDKELINSLFRAIHTIKGSAGFVGMQNIGKLAHVMENILSKIREGNLVPTPNHVSGLLEGCDHLKAMINEPNTSNTYNYDTTYKLLQNLETNKIDSKKEEKNASKSEDPKSTVQSFITPTVRKANEKPKKVKIENAHLEIELITDFVNEAIKYLETAESGIYELSANMENYSKDLLQKILRAIDTISGTSNLVGLTTIYKLSHTLTILLKSAIEKKTKTDSHFINILFSATDKLHFLFDEVMHSNNTDIEEIIIDINQYFTPQPEETFTPNQNAENKKIAQTNTIYETNNSENVIPTPKKEITEVKVYEKNDTVRLNITILDKLMRLAGELVLVRNQQLSMLDQTTGFYREVIHRLNSITSEMQETVMQTRLQPIGMIFNKFPRVIRDMAGILNKKIDLQILGADVELDKTIIEALAAPLTHLIRNAADHGLENSEERMLANKSVEGKIVLNAYHEAGFINITITDDGKGINPLKIKQKAQEKGLKSTQELNIMNEKELLNLIFLPGFSTADKVSEISGRGVGMDVVKSSIEKLSGFIELNSQPDKGTSILMKLPLTLAIIPCIIVSYQSYRYAIPQLNIEELVTLYPNSGNVIEYINDREVYRLRDKLIPIIRLSDVLLINYKFTSQTHNDIIRKYHFENINENKITEFAILRIGNNRYGLVFDTVIGTEEIVVKPLHQALKNIRIYSGATILGDGKIALIIDVDGIANHASVDFDLKSSVIEQTSNVVEAGKVESLLLFRNGANEQFAIPISLIKRIEQISTDKIEFAGGKEFVGINSISYRIIRLESYINVSRCIEQPESHLLMLKHVQKPVGLFFSQIVDIQNIRVEISTQSYTSDGILGTAIINDRMTLFLDAYRLIEMADPLLYDKKAIQLNKMKESMPLSENLKVLVVDDSTVFRQMISNYLIHDGYEVKSVTNGKEALILMEEQLFDIIVCDLEMPIMTGFEFIEMVRNSSIQKKIPALALSSNTNEAIIQRALKSGFNEYQIKVDKEQLLQTIKNLIYASTKNHPVIHLT